jgi:hypothetical protein
MKKLTKIEADRMKKIIFSKLLEHGTYYKVKNIYLSNKRFRRVYMNQEWGNCERSLQRLKGIFSFNSPKKRLILPNQLNKKGHY